ncbi:MAG: hypothetical protein IT305_17330 [Chloroflexi bacterium]|nr:hypothetical protein [Chloroflexota bacterium]
MTSETLPAQPCPSSARGGRRRRGSSLLAATFVLAIVVFVVAPYQLLLPKIALDGVVRDAATGQPIRGARVRIGPSGATTDSGGAFGIARASLTERLRVDADGYLPTQVAAWPPRGRNIVLAPRTFALNVRDAETGEPIADASLAGDGVRARTAGPGRFQIGPARPSLTVTISGPGYRDTTIRYDGRDEVVAALSPRIVGTVTDARSGRPVPGAFLVHADGSATADTQGNFELESRPSGTLQVLAPGYRRADLIPGQERPIAVQLEPFTARAVYLTYYAVGDRGLRENALALAEKTDVNAVVIDVKGERGLLAYRSDVALADTIGANGAHTIENPEELLASLKRRGLYTIARIVVFKDDPLARNGPRAGLDVAAKNGLTGGPWVDAEGMAWVDPLRPEVWEYNIALAREAARKGFDEIQFSYVRFPASATSGTSLGTARFSQAWLTDAERVDALTTFLRRAREQVRLAGAYVGTDVFGYVAWNDDDTGTGQSLASFADAVDYLCPMVYPSAFRAGLPALIPYPQVIGRPYDVVLESVRRAHQRSEGKVAVVRPWLQYFDDYPWQTGRAYTAQDIAAQRRGAAEGGGVGWMMWDPSNRYARGGFGAHP